MTASMGHPARGNVRRRTTQRACTAAALITTALLTLPLLSGVRFFGLDLERVDLGLLCDAQRAAGWISPWLGNGTPRLAEPHAQWLYPPRWIALALPVDLGLAFGLVFHLAVGAAATAWLARSWGARALVATCAGVAFAFSGMVLDLMRHTTYVVAAAWLPLGWAAARYALRSPDPRGALLMLGFSLVGNLLGAEPQAFALVVGLVGLESLAYVRRRGRSRWSRGALVMATVVPALLLGLTQWNITLAELALTPRREGLDLTGALGWSFTPVSWLAALEPNILHQPLRGETTLWQQDAGAIGSSMWNRTPYVGPVLLALALSAVKVRRAWTVVLVLVVGLLFSLGDQTPVLPTLMRLLPPLTMFRYPEKYLVVTTLAAVVLAAMALQRIAERRALLAACLASVLAFQLLLMGWLAAHASELESMVEAGLPDEQIARTAHRPTLGLMLQNAALAPTLAVVATLILLLAGRRHLRALPVVLTVDLLLAALGTVELGPTLHDVVSPLRALNAAAPPPVICHHPSLIGLNLGVVGEAGEAPAWNQAFLLRLLDIPSMQACDEVSAATAYSPLQTRVNRHLSNALERDDTRAARALGCTHLVTTRPFVDPGVRPVNVPDPGGVFSGVGVHVLALDRPVPETFVVPHPRFVASEEALLTALESTDEPLSLVDDPLGRLPAGAALPSGDGVTVRALRWEQRDHAVLEASGSGGALLGLRTAFHVGWRAEQAGRALPVVRVSGSHVAAVVDDVTQGTVTLRYSPPRLAESASCALAGLTLMALQLFLARRRR
ncbi:MAG: hypothetical protein AB2A00_29550 [Myxococcota bacterium]